VFFRLSVIAAVLSLAACSDKQTCKACSTSKDCATGAACVQYAGSDYCGHVCTQASDCASGETCFGTSSLDGLPYAVCMPANGACSGSGCSRCGAGLSCDLIAGSCVAPVEDAGEDGGNDAGMMSGYDGGIGPDGGSVSRLYFVVVGDTRPRMEDDTAHYPTAVIEQIYKDIAAMNPQPQFVITTGDYQFAATYNSESLPQLSMYMHARAQYGGPVFPVMGNHECTGATAGNCDPTLPTPNLIQFSRNLMAPIGKTDLYYSIDINDTAGQWTSKFLFTACNAWTQAQQDWLTAQLARPTTFTFIVRHMALGSNGPCNAPMDPIVAGASYTAMLAGHSHLVSYDSSQKQLIEGVGGAPLSSSYNYGYATVQQEDDGTFTIKQIDYETLAVERTFTVGP
jgi:hypothetical protein